MYTQTMNVPTPNLAIAARVGILRYDDPFTELFTTPRDTNKRFVNSGLSRSRRPSILPSCGAPGANAPFAPFTSTQSI